MNDRKTTSTGVAAGRENVSAGDSAMEDDLTEEREITPEQREDVAEDLNMDP